jgi:hypothetical protein
VTRILCLLGLHRRSRGRAHVDEHGMVSICRRCGVAMRRDRNGIWRVSVDDPSD